MTLLGVKSSKVQRNVGKTVAWSDLPIINEEPQKPRLVTGEMLLNKLALVTGGGSGIGRAICQTFAREGAQVIVTDVNDAGVQTTLGSLHGERSKHFAVHSDISCANFVKQLAEIVEKQYKGRAPDIVVNNAGIAIDAMLPNVTEANWDWVQSVNLKGPFLVTQAFSQQMLAQKLPGGSIINISSILARIGNTGQASYCASKAGLLGLTKTVARELARFNIRCNAVLPGWIETPMTDAVPQKLQDAAMRQIPMRRKGQPQEIANVCLFLASDLSSYMTGACVEVTGGLGA